MDENLSTSGGPSNGQRKSGYWLYQEFSWRLLLWVAWSGVTPWTMGEREASVPGPGPSLASPVTSSWRQPGHQQSVSPAPISNTNTTIISHDYIRKITFDIQFIMMIFHLIINSLKLIIKLIGLCLITWSSFPKELIISKGAVLFECLIKPPPLLPKCGKIFIYLT